MNKPGCCSCHISPPCFYCTEAACLDCGEQGDEDGLCKCDRDDAAPDTEPAEEEPEDNDCPQCLGSGGGLPPCQCPACGGSGRRVQVRGVSRWGRRNQREDD